MSEPTSKRLRPNPFTTYRDPKTGKWMVIQSERSESNDLESDSPPKVERLRLLQGGIQSVKISRVRPATKVPSSDSRHPAQA